MSEYSFNIALAKSIGVDEAIMVKNLCFWIHHNQANGTHYYEGRYWTYNSVKAFVEIFPFWTAKELRRIMESLYKQNVVIKGNFNKLQFDKTGWYSLTDDYQYLIDILSIAQMGKGNAEKGNTIPYVKTNSSLLKNKEGKKTKVFVPPSLDQVKEFFKEKGYSEEAAINAFGGYDVAEWEDSKGNKIKNWKQKMYHVWFKAENKVQQPTSATKFQPEIVFKK